MKADESRKVKRQVLKICKVEVVNPMPKGIGLRRARWAANMTQVELSQKSGVEQGVISMVETGKMDISNCSFFTVYNLANALGVSIDTLIEQKNIDRMMLHRLRKK